MLYLLGKSNDVGSEVDFQAEDISLAWNFGPHIFNEENPSRNRDLLVCYLFVECNELIFF